MAPVLSGRSLGASSISAIHLSSPRFGLGRAGRTSSLFPNHVNTRSRISLSSANELRWNAEKRRSRLMVKCEAAVAEKGADEASEEKFEYQAEVCSPLL